MLGAVVLSVGIGIWLGFFLRKACEKMLRRDDPHPQVGLCPTCGGTGLSDDLTSCTDCNGTGAALVSSHTGAVWNVGTLRS